jgi:chromosome segregation ATPase
MITQIRAEKTLLETQYQEQAQILTNLQADYAALQAQVGTSTDYQQLQTQYNTLNTDYQNLGRDLSTTRMMMYAAVVVAVASVGVAVYFGAIKKS